MSMDAMPREAAARRPRAPGELIEFSPDPLARPREDVRINNVVLWLAALGGPVSWAVHLVLMYPGVEVACRAGSAAPLYSLSALMSGTAALAGAVNWRYLRAMRSRNGATMPGRVRFMATAGLIGAVLFLLGIAAGTLPVLFDDPCQLPGRRRTPLIPFL